MVSVESIVYAKLIVAITLTRYQKRENRRSRFIIRHQKQLHFLKSAHFNSKDFKIKKMGGGGGATTIIRNVPIYH